MHTSCSVGAGTVYSESVQYSTVDTLIAVWRRSSADSRERFSSLAPQEAQEAPDFLTQPAGSKHTCSLSRSSGLLPRASVPFSLIT